MMYDSEDKKVFSSLGVKQMTELHQYFDLCSPALEYQKSQKVKGLKVKKGIVEMSQRVCGAPVAFRWTDLSVVAT